MRAGASRALFALSLVACGGGSGGPGGGGTAVQQFCQAASRAPDCDTPSQCEGRFQQGLVLYPRCADLFNKFAACVSQLQLACIASNDFEIHATGDGSAVSDPLRAVPVYLFYVQDTACRKIAEDLQACSDCSQAIGYPGGRGIGDKCSSSAPCASGLTCDDGMCTRDCGDDGNCLGTNAVPHNCWNQYALDNQCVNNKCVSTCESANNLCKAYGPTWMCTGGGVLCGH